MTVYGGDVRIGRPERRNAPRRGGCVSGDRDPYDVWVVPDLKKRAKELGLTGYSHKRKGDLIATLWRR